MGYNSLDGNIPGEIANFSYLENLNLEGNKLTGVIPKGIFNMSFLIEINLKNNKLTGEIPSDTICSSNDTPKLKRLYLSGNNLFGGIPANIYKCRELEELHLLMNNFSGSIPSEIGNLQKLTNFSLWSNNFKGTIFSYLCYSFRYLYIGKIVALIP